MPDAKLTEAERDAAYAEAVARAGANRPVRPPWFSVFYDQMSADVDNDD